MSCFRRCDRAALPGGRCRVSNCRGSVSGDVWHFASGSRQATIAPSAEINIASTAATLRVVEFMEVTVPADRGTRAAIPRFFLKSLTPSETMQQTTVSPLEVPAAIRRDDGRMTRSSESLMAFGFLAARPHQTIVGWYTLVVSVSVQVMRFPSDLSAFLKVSAVSPRERQ
jgi:hypothetical protein